MSFKLIRTHFESRLNEIDADFQRVDKPFDTDDVPNNNFNKRFHIFYGELSPVVPNQNVTSDTCSATVTLYFDGCRDDVTKLDDAWDIANAFRLRCAKPKFLKNEKFIKRIFANSIIATPLNSNDNLIKITLRFSITAMFGTEDNLEC